MTPRVHRQIRLTGLANGAELTMRTLYGEDHLVVPVVALVGDAVVRPLNSKGAEFVPAEELRKSTHQWAGRPVVPDHPDNGRASANDPATLEAMGFGSTFNPRFEDGRLKLEAWLNLKRAAALGGDAQKVVDRARAGEMIEVSVGAWVAVLESPGVSPSGQSYQYRWSEIDSDHLAMLPEGAEGACNAEMGCGAPRAARAKEHKPMNRGLLTRLFETLGLRSAQDDEGLSDADLRGSLWDALRAVEPGFDGIVEVFPDSGTVIYAAFPEHDLIFYRRSFSMAGDGEVSLADDREEVEPVTRFEPVAAEAEPTETKEPSAAEDCGCEKNGRSIRAAETSTAAEAGKDGHMTKKELVERLIAAERSPFTKDDTKALEAMSEERLQALEETFQEPEEPEEEAEPQKAAPLTEPEPQKVAPPATPPEDVVQLRKSEYERMRAATEAHEAEQKARKDGLVAQLKGAQTTYTEAELKTRGVDDLQKLASLLKLDEPRRDYSGQGMPITSASKKATLPDAYGLGEKFTN